MSEQESSERIISLWEGQSKLLDTWGEDRLVAVWCLFGQGYLRRMNESQRRFLAQGERVVMGTNNVISITAKEDMQIKVEIIH